jgi:carbamate kinase
MKTQSSSKAHNATAAVVDQKNPQFRSGTKSFAHRYERRKIREQLRHLDWALAGVD